MKIYFIIYGGEKWLILIMINEKQNAYNFLFFLIQYMESWVPAENPCMICMCLNQQRINCTARPCSDVKRKPNNPSSLVLQRH